MNDELHPPANRERPPTRTDTSPPDSGAEWRLIETPAYPGARNMAIDVVLAESVRDGGPPVLRFYRWWPPCISLGRNQEARGHYDTAEAERRGIEFVRRPTGGRSVFHYQEITYSVVVRDRALGGPRQAYHSIHEALVAGLQELGAAADTAPHSGPASRPSTLPCFQELDAGAVVIEGRKLVGSAQLREQGIILQHGSILLAGDQSPTLELLRVRRPTDTPERLAVLKEVLPSLPTWAELTGALELGFRHRLGIGLADSELDASERGRLMRHVRRFSDPSWTWRR